MALFALYGWVNQGAVDSPDEIVVDSNRIDTLRSEFERVWQRPPTQQELAGLIDGWVREEILYREGVALGLDRNDPVLKRRIAQRVSFMLEQVRSETPDEQALIDWLEENAEDYRFEPTYSFRQVFFDPERHAESLPDALETAREMLADGADPAMIGDNTLLLDAMAQAPLSQISRNFGTEFAESLAGIELGSWVGPVPSAYGVHLVRVDAMTPAREATLDEVRDAVQRDLDADRRQQAEEAVFDLLRERYRVRLADDVATGFELESLSASP
jgi:hypothetical protein